MRTPHREPDPSPSARRWAAWVKRLPGAVPGRAGRRGVLFIDGILVRLCRVEVFADDPGCILRVSRRRLDKPMILPDGTYLRSGDLVIELHFWNEHLPLIEVGGADVQWGTRFTMRLAHSLRLLAAWAEGDPRYRDFVAVHGLVGFIRERDVDQLKRPASRLGFLLELRTAPGLRFWTGAYWAGVYSWWLMWTFNPHTLRSKRLRDMASSDLWMTRQTLLAHYGTGAWRVRPAGKRGEET